MEQDKQNASQTVKVAGVVSFYMGAALVVSLSAAAVPNSVLMPSFSDGLRVRIAPVRSGVRSPCSHGSNKAVLNSSPDLPLLV